MVCGCENQTDRYKTFAGIDCDGNARQVMALIEKYVAQVEESRAFWEYFMAKRQPRSGPKPDDLFLRLCSRKLWSSSFGEPGLLDTGCSGAGAPSH